MDPNITISVYELDPGSALFQYFEFFCSQLEEYLLYVLENLFFFVIAYFILCFIIYYSEKNKKKACKTFDNAKRALVVIAHPDDECMFFGPTILRLKQRGIEVYLLCLSIGNYQKHGHIRLMELYDACGILGINKGNIVIYIDSSLPDDSKLHWPSDHVATIILHHVEAFSIDALVTFDKVGVSRHPNHASIFYGVARLCIEKRFPPNCCIFTLDSVNLLRKYWGYIDLPLSFLLSSHRFVLCNEERNMIKHAMMKHKSQMLWFRYLYLLFSRYISINTLRHVTLSDFELDLEVDD